MNGRAAATGLALAAIGVAGGSLAAFVDGVTAALLLALAAIVPIAWAVSPRAPQIATRYEQCRRAGQRVPLESQADLPVHFEVAAVMSRVTVPAAPPRYS